MTDKTQPNNVRQYQVRMGHTKITVQGDSPEETVRHARRQLCLDIPRMWDVIQTIEEGRFVVDLLEYGSP